MTALEQAQKLPGNPGVDAPTNPAANLGSNPGSNPSLQSATAGLARAQARRPSWLREPLLHFLLLGALLFAVDHWVAGKADDPRVIVISPAVHQEASQLFKASRGREPNPAEWAALRNTWLDNEVLYREGLAMQVDRGDTAIRERVIFKALSVVSANVQRPAVTDEILRAWFEKNRGKYDEPARLDFQEAVLPGDNSELAVRAFVEQLNKGTGGDLGAGLRVFKGRPLPTLVQSYGAEFAQNLVAATGAANGAANGVANEWQAMNTREGWRVIRADGLTAAKPASYEALRNGLLQDWADEVMAEQRTQAVRALARKYTVQDQTQKP